MNRMMIAPTIAARKPAPSPGCTNQHVAEPAGDGRAADSSAIVMRQPPGSRPGMMNLAMAPASAPMMIHDNQHNR